MKKINFINWIVSFILIIAIGGCSKDNNYQSREDYLTDVYRDQIYGSNTNWLGENVQLGMDVYLPEGAIDDSSEKKYPFLLYIHGGGFHTGDKSTAEGFARLMNEKGYVVASINYRLGWTHDENNFCAGDTLEGRQAVYRALQDARAALRYSVANAEKFKIDTNWIFVGGASAGGVTSLAVSYITPENAELIFPGYAETMGPLDATNSLTNQFTIQGISSMWGALSDISIITPSNAKPTIFFHGMKDIVCPYDISHFYSCDNFPASYGSKPIYDRITSFGIPAVANIDPEGGHGVYTIPFRAENTACFLNSLMAKQVETGYYTDGKGNCIR